MGLNKVGLASIPGPQLRGADAVSWGPFDDWPFGKKLPEAKSSPDRLPIFENPTGFLDDESAQNKQLPDDFYDFIGLGPDCDEIPGAFGEFGRTATNPVPVNSQMGELIYLSRLTTRAATPVLFHRLGCLKGEVDVFEVISEDGKYWDLLYLDMYYPRKSRTLPSGYRPMDMQVRYYLIRGTNLRLDSFPRGLHRKAVECTRRIFG
ncbi:MAG TPA: hypothetical protein VMT98_02525, partial [Verrucomicrobiae bacterium]|nr:hypothetical protein [Verrucomicrobiae bacterium]